MKCRHTGIFDFWFCIARGMVSPAGGTGDGENFALRGDLLCPRRQSRQSATGVRRLEKHSVFLCRLPRTPCFSTGEPPRGVEKICPARAKDRIPFFTPPAAAPCWLNRLMLLQERLRLVFSPRGAVRWLLRLRGWYQICKTAVNTHLRQVRTRQRFRRPQAYSGVGPFRLPSPGGYIQ